MPLAPVGNPKPLTIRDRQFLAIYFANGMNATQAYLEAARLSGKEITHNTAEVQGSKAVKRIRQSGDFRAILEERGLDDIRLANEIYRLSRVQRLAFSPSGAKYEYDDGPTQAKAAEMLKDVLGHNSPQEINLNSRQDNGLTLVLEGAKDLPAEEVVQ